MAKPTIRRFMGKWVCQTANGDNIGFDRYQQLFSTQRDSPEAAWRNWYESIRTFWAWSAGVTHEQRKNFKGSLHAQRLLAQKCATLIGHDRYLMKVDGR